MKSASSQHDLLNALLNATPDAVVVQTGGGAVTEVNARFCELTGYARHELLHAPQESPPQLWVNPPQTPDYHGPGTVLSKDGRPLPVELHQSTAADGARVIVARPLAETASGDALARAILSSHPAHIAVLDERGKIVAVNEAWERFAQENGGSGAFDIGMSYLDVCGRCARPGSEQSAGEDAADATAAADGIRDVIAGRREFFQLEYPCHSPAQQRWFLMTVGPLREAGVTGTGGNDGGAARETRRLRGAIVSHLDISRRKRAEENLRRHVEELDALARQLQKSNAELDQFAYVASHDLRAPLRGIANLSRWIEEEIGEAALTREARRMLELLRGRVTRMESLIDGILEYSRVGRARIGAGAGSGSAAAARIDVGKLLLETIDLLAPPPPARVELATEMPVIVGDRLRLQQVFMNLIGNAIKHSGRPDVRVTISCRDAGPRSEASRPGGMVEFAVADNGTGIEPQYHQKIFVIFQTLLPRDKVEGAGVGLSLVKKIVESQGGQIRVDSAPGRGATFAFTWPRHASGVSSASSVLGPPAPAQPQPTSPPAPNGSPKGV